MRIISGIARGRKLFTPGQSTAIRPTTDRAREALFSIIGDRVVSARVLDLYAGTGALGLEALSRGARQAVFVDSHPKALELIKKNCTLCLKNSATGKNSSTLIIKHDLRRGLNMNLPALTEDGVFDLVFLDPPYEKGLAQASLEALSTSQLLAQTSLIIAEECSGEKLPASFTRLALTDQRRYGDTGFWFYKFIESS